MQAETMQREEQQGVGARWAKRSQVCLRRPGMHRALTFCVVVALLAGAATAWAVPQQLGYQGRLFDATGNPVEGAKEITFTLYDGSDPATATARWTETQTLGLTRGFYATQLGTVVPFPEGLFDGRVLWLAITVDGETLTPLQQVGSVAYAMRAQLSERVPPESVGMQELKRGALFADLALDKPVQAVGGVLVGRGPTSGLGRNNYWATQEFPSTLTLDLGKVYTQIDAIVFESHFRTDPNEIPGQYTLEVSEDISDENNWRPVPSVRPVNNDVFFHPLSGDTRTFRYLRLKVLAPAAVGRAVQVNLLRVLSYSLAGENSHDICPDGWVSAARGRVCLDPTVRGPDTIWNAHQDCGAMQARVCTYADFMQICGAGFDPFATANTVGWIGEHGAVQLGNAVATDDVWLTWNATVCDGNIDGSPAVAAATPPPRYVYYCCM